MSPQGRHPCDGLFMNSAGLSAPSPWHWHLFGGLRGAVAPNWLRSTAGSDGPVPAALRGRAYAVYAGSSGRKQDMDLLAQAADELAARRGPVIAVLGTGPGHEAVQRVSRYLVCL